MFRLPVTIITKPAMSCFPCSNIQAIHTPALPPAVAAPPAALLPVGWCISAPLVQPPAPAAGLPSPLLRPGLPAVEQLLLLRQLQERWWRRPQGQKQQHLHAACPFLTLLLSTEEPSAWMKLLKALLTAACEKRVKYDRDSNYLCRETSAGLACFRSLTDQALPSQC